MPLKLHEFHELAIFVNAVAVAATNNSLKGT